MSVFAWVAMTLYEDKVDNLCVQELLRSPGTQPIYRCFRTFLHGFCLYLILLLLAHLSDMQHRSSSSHIFTIPESTNLRIFFHKNFFVLFLFKVEVFYRDQKCQYNCLWGFHLVAKIIRELKSHMIPYKFKCSHWLKLQHSDSRANLVKDFF